MKAVFCTLFSVLWCTGFAQDGKECIENERFKSVFFQSIQDVENAVNHADGSSKLKYEKGIAFLKHYVYVEPGTSLQYQNIFTQDAFNTSKTNWRKWYEAHKCENLQVTDCIGFESAYSALLTDKNKPALDFIGTVKNGVAFYYTGHSMAYMDIKVLSFDGTNVTCFKNSTEKRTLAIKEKEWLNISKLLDGFTEQKCYYSRSDKNEDLRVITVIKDGVPLIRYLAEGGLFPDKTSNSELNTLKELYEATAKFQYRDK